MDHYLITIALGVGGNYHGYLMHTAGLKRTDTALNVMFNELAKHGATPFPQFVLVTKLSGGEAIVRDIIKTDPGLSEAARKIETATNFHFTSFMMSENHPDHNRLMALH